jgi:hypothetical protein
MRMAFLSAVTIAPHINWRDMLVAVAGILLTALWAEGLASFRADTLSKDAAAPPSSYVCRDFFTVLAELQPWRTGGSELCADTFVRMDYSFRAMSSQMEEMNSTLYIFTTYRPQRHCQVPYPHLQLVYFDPTDLMEEFHASHIIPIFENIYYDDYAKISDILRVLLARKYRLTYIDLDIHFLDTAHASATYGDVEFVAMHVWNENHCSLEITNAAFCFSPSRLVDLQRAMLAQIEAGNIYRYHTELGPTLFAKVLTNSATPLFFYTVNHPELFPLPQMTSEIRRYRHRFLHLTSSLRQLLQESQPSSSFESYVDQLRSLLSLPPLRLPASVTSPESYFYALQAMIANHPAYPNRLELSLRLGELSVERHLGHCREDGQLEEVVEESYYESIEALNALLILTGDPPDSAPAPGPAPAADRKSRQAANRKAKELIDVLDRQTCTSLGREEF